MQTSARIRVLIHCRGADAELFRTLVSLSRQTIGSKRFDIALASSAPAEHASREARLLHSALDFGSVDVLDATAQSPARALNIAALNTSAGGAEQWLLPVPTGTRLSPRFAAACLAAADARTQAVFSAHTAGTVDGAPFIRVRPFSVEQLTRCNPVGSTALVRREAWETLGGLRPELRLAMWDFWLRLALSGGGIARVPTLLTYGRPLSRQTSWRDGQAKALLVVATPGAFEPDVCRWALALLRGDTWAQPFDSGRIPTPREVRTMAAEALARTYAARPEWEPEGLRTA